MKISISKLLVGSLLLLSACGVSVDQAQARVGANGGTVRLASGLELEVPAGALRDDTTVRVTERRHDDGVVEVELEPGGTALAVPGRLSMSDDGAGEFEATEIESGERHEVRRDGRGRAELDVRRLGRIRIGHHVADGGVDDHGGDRDAGIDDHGGDRDGGSDDGAVGTGGACVTNDVCPCGSECVGGQCTAVVTCSTDADCSGGASCREGRRSGVACGVFACHL